MGRRFEPRWRPAAHRPFEVFEAGGFRSEEDDVLDVDNELRIAARGVSGDAEIEQRVRMTIKGDERFIDTSLQLEVKAGLVRLRGLFQNPVDVLALKHRIASIPGVLGVEIDAVLVAHRAMPDRTRGSSLALTGPLPS